MNTGEILLDKFCSQVFIHYRQTKDIKSKEELWDTRLELNMQWLY